MAARDALIVAVAGYSDAKLKRLRAPAADAEQLSAVLKDPAVGGFDVAVAADPTEGELRRRLARFFSDRRPDDLLLLHFSCHGVKDDRGELYLAATDTDSDPDLLTATAIAAGWLNDQISRCRSKRIVVFLDCCFSGSFRLGMQPRSGDRVDVTGHLGGRGRAVITASNAMEYAFEGDEVSGAGEPSIFTGAVVEALATGRADRDGDGLISIDELYDYVYDDVRAQTPAQTPMKLSTLEGPLYIARSSHRAGVEPPPAGDPPAGTATNVPAAAAAGAHRDSPGARPRTRPRATADIVVAVCAMTLVLTATQADDPHLVRYAAIAALALTALRAWLLPAGRWRVAGGAAIVACGLCAEAGSMRGPEVLEDQLWLLVAAVGIVLAGSWAVRADGWSRRASRPSTSESIAVICGLALIASLWLSWSQSHDAWYLSKPVATLLALLCAIVVMVVALRAKGPRFVRSAAEMVAVEAIGAALLVIIVRMGHDAIDPTGGRDIAVVAALGITAAGAIGRLQTRLSGVEREAP